MSVRTLHHYDALGILPPTGHTAAGYRLYDQDSVVRLVHIRGLRQLGLSLAQVRAYLTSPGFSAKELVAGQLARLDEQARLLATARQRLRKLAELLEVGQPASSDVLLATLEAMNMLEKHYTQEQLDWLENRRQQLGVHEVEDQWRDLFARFTEFHAQGLDPGHPAVAEAARQAKGLVAQFTGGRADVAASLGSLYETGEGQAMVAQHMPVSPEVWRLLQEAMAEVG
ncbi:MAG: MerR family transcriptional regulator [Candidatus Eremiobacteraeota bacterium]|nr:MerR family transcriptional regulator [Candidatus Eremiobacteraeota bacterium]